MGRFRDLARRAKNALRDRVRDGGMPSSPPDISEPPKPEPTAAPASTPAPSDEGEGQGEETPWYLQGDEDAYGWEHTNAKDDAE